MKDPNDDQTEDCDYDEDFPAEPPYDSYAEHGVRREDFAWHGCYNKN